MIDVDRNQLQLLYSIRPTYIPFEMYSCMLVEYILYIIMVGWINGCFLQENGWKLDSHCSIGLIFFKKRLKTLHFWSIAMTNQLNVDTAHWKSNAFVKAKKVPLRQISTISLSRLAPEHTLGSKVHHFQKKNQFIIRTQAKGWKIY